MTSRNLFVAGIAALAGVLAITPDASAIGKRNRGGSSCSSCSTPAPAPSGCGGGGYSGCGGCGVAIGGGYVGGYAVAAPEAMPATGTTTGTAQTTPPVQPGAVTPTGGAGEGFVVPATGTTVTPQGAVIPTGGYYQNGNYVTPAGYGTFQNGFGAGVIQGATGTSYYAPYGSTVGGTVGNYAGSQVGRGLFRRR